MAKYYSEYYEANKNKILERRREKYSEDAEFRSKQQTRARKRSVKMAKVRHANKADANVYEAHRLAALNLELDKLSSQQVKRWPIGTFLSSSIIAKALGISIGTVNNWLRSGMLPPPTVHEGLKNYLFSLDYFENIRASRIKALMDNMTKEEMQHLFWDNYEKIKDLEDLFKKG